MAGLPSNTDVSLSPAWAQLLSVRLAFLSWSYFFPFRPPSPFPHLSGAETRNLSSNLQPGRFSLPWSPGACSICSSVAFPQGDSSLLPLPKKESWGQLLRFLKIIFFTSLLKMGKSLRFKMPPGCLVVLVFFYDFVLSGTLL